MTAQVGARWLAHGENRHMEAVQGSIDLRSIHEARKISAAPMFENARMDGNTVAALAGFCGVSVAEFAGRYAS